MHLISIRCGSLFQYWLLISYFLGKASCFSDQNSSRVSHHPFASAVEKTGWRHLIFIHYSCLIYQFQTNQRAHDMKIETTKPVFTNLNCYRVSFLVKIKHYYNSILLFTLITIEISTSKKNITGFVDSFFRFFMSWARY